MHWIKIGERYLDLDTSSTVTPYEPHLTDDGMTCGMYRHADEGKFIHLTGLEYADLTAHLDTIILNGNRPANVKLPWTEEDFEVVMRFFSPSVKEGPAHHVAVANFKTLIRKHGTVERNGIRYFFGDNGDSIKWEKISE